MASKGKAQESKAQDRRERAAALRREQEARDRRQRRLVLIGAGVVAVVLVGAVVVAVSGGGSSKSSSTATVEKPAVVVPDTSGIPGVVAYDTAGYPAPGKESDQTLEHQHVLGPVTYSITPPVGGPHNGTWMSCGIYTKPVPSERAVHDLEHGAVWITYRPSLPAADVQALTDLVLRQKQVNGARYVDLTPWASDALPSPVVISAWGRQLRVTSATDPRLQAFIDAFRSTKGITPELGSPCGGVPVDVGGRPARS
jgi:hypothetical protein